MLKVGPKNGFAALGHGVLPKTPEENVKKSVELIHERFTYSPSL